MSFAGSDIIYLWLYHILYRTTEGFGCRVRNTTIICSYIIEYNNIIAGVYIYYLLHIAIGEFGQPAYDMILYAIRRFFTVTEPRPTISTYIHHIRYSIGTYKISTWPTLRLYNIYNIKYTILKVVTRVEFSSLQFSLM